MAPSRAERNITRRAERLRAGLCPVCGGVRGGPEKICMSCRAAAAERLRSWVRAQRDRGLCAKCSEPRAEPRRGYRKPKLCIEHLAYMAKDTAAREAKRRVEETKPWAEVALSNSSGPITHLGMRLSILKYVRRENQWPVGVESPTPPDKIDWTGLP